jgi:two-component system nitrate/nitrite response regulator NarL
MAVVLADDQVLFLDAVRARLTTEADIDVVAIVQTGADAILQAEQLRPAVVIVSDRLSSFDVPEGAKLIAARSPDTRTMLLSVNLTPRDIVSGLAAGVWGFVDKSSSFDELARAIRCVADGDMWIPQNLLSSTVLLMLETREESFARRRVLDRLSRREKAVLALVARGENNESMAKELMISPQTAKTHVQHVLQKLGVHSRIAAAAFAMQEGIVDELEECM